MKYEICKPSDYFSVLSLLQKCKIDRDSNGTSEGVDKWLFQYFMKVPAKADLEQRACATEEDEQKQEGR